MAAGPLQSAGPSLISGELPAETGQVNLFSVVKVTVVICQVLEKCLTWVKSIYKRKQKRFPRNRPPTWKKSFMCVSVYVR